MLRWRSSHRHGGATCDGLFAAIGRVPGGYGPVAGQVELDPSGYIVADETTRTSVPASLRWAMPAPAKAVPDRRHRSEPTAVAARSVYVS